MPDQQKKFDFTRAEQLGILRTAVLPKITGLAPVVVKSVLRVIDDHARRDGQCYASQETIASEANCSLRQVERSVAGLVALSLITKERQKIGRGRRTQNFHRIVWSELALLSHLPRNDQPATDGGLISSDQPAISSDQPAISSDQPAMGGGFLGSALSAFQKRLPLPPTNEAAEWKKVEEGFFKKFDFGAIGKHAAAARAAGESPQDFGRRVADLFAAATHPLNRKAVDKPAGAVDWHLNYGRWPDAYANSNLERTSRRRAVGYSRR